jgi:hypothetical protein
MVCEVCDFCGRRTCRHRKYGFWKFMLDILMVFVTGGLWIIWIFVREMRGR